MYVGTKSTLHKKHKNKIHRPQRKALYVDDRLVWFKLSVVAKKNSINTKSFQAQWSCELELSFIVDGAAHNRHQGYKAERFPTGKKYLTLQNPN